MIEKISLGPGRVINTATDAIHVALHGRSSPNYSTRKARAGRLHLMDGREGDQRIVMAMSGLRFYVYERQGWPWGWEEVGA